MRIFKQFGGLQPARSGVTLMEVLDLDLCALDRVDGNGGPDSGGTVLDRGDGQGRPRGGLRPRGLREIKIRRLMDPQCWGFGISSQIKGQSVIVDPLGCRGPQ